MVNTDSQIGSRETRSDQHELAVLAIVTPPGPTRDSSPTYPSVTSRMHWSFLGTTPSENIDQALKQPGQTQREHM